MRNHKSDAAADKVHDLSTVLTEVTEAYTKLVDCIATIRDRRIQAKAEGNRDIRHDS